MKVFDVIQIILLIFLLTIIFSDRFKKEKYDVWILKGQKFTGNVVELEPGWEPFGYSKDANIIYLKKRGN